MDTLDKRKRFEKALELNKKQKFRAKYLRARTQYLKEKQRGENKVVVDEWDQFEREREQYKIEKYEKENNMAKFRVRFQLSKNYNVAEFEASDIDTYEEAVDLQNIVRQEAINMINALPDNGFGRDEAPKYKQKQTGSQNTYQKYPPKQKSTQNVGGGNYTPDMISWNGAFGSPKQVNLFIKPLNEGKISIQEVNNITTYEDMQKFIKTRIFKK